MSENQKSDKNKADEASPKQLSKADAELWEKVQKTLDSPASKTKTSFKNRNDKVTISQTSSKKPAVEDFSKLLEESNAPATQQPKQHPKQSPEAARKLVKKSPHAPAKIESFSHQEARALSSGKQAIEGMIDLHGFTQKQAESALKAFLKRTQTDGKRFVLVITGKGDRGVNDQTASFELGAPEPGILRRQVPVWLDEMPETVVSYKTSHKKHGGEGALYVRLRRLKPLK